MKKSSLKVKNKDRHRKDKKSSKVSKVLHEYKEGALHSGSKKGPKVKKRSQAVAIALSEARKAGEKAPKLKLKHKKLRSLKKKK